MKQLSFIAAGFCTATALTGGCLATVLPAATADGIDDVTIIVSSACTMSATDGHFTAALDSGIYKDNFGNTAFTVSCNDSAGWSVYAIGNSSQDSNRTAMIDSADPSNVIATGTATSGTTSNWAMKLNTGTGATADTIKNGYGSFSVVPDEQTIVAGMTSGIDQTGTVSLSTQYAVYVSASQALGNYVGKVKYTLVHPSGAAPANEVTE